MTDSTTITVGITLAGLVTVGAVYLVLRRAVLHAEVARAQVAVLQDLLVQTRTRLEILDAITRELLGKPLTPNLMRELAFIRSQIADEGETTIVMSRPFQPHRKEFRA